MTEILPRSFWHRPVIVGGGLAGAVAALTLAPQPVLLVDSGSLGGAPASRWAQGGLAAAVGPDDSPDLQMADTLSAGAGLCDAEAARRIVGEGPAVVRALENFGVRFDRGPDDALALGLEAAHSRRRILHVRDATGAAILDALWARIAETPSIAALPARAVDLVVGDAGVGGIVLEMGGARVAMPTASVLLATGGVGALWASTTNPRGAEGRGLAMAARVGAVLRDIEFMQFHPTALATGADPMPLISEAVRGEGATLIDADGRRFMAAVAGAELAPRDVVARAVFAEWAGGGSAALDVRGWEKGRFAARFPNITGVLAGFGLDPERDPIPVRPAAHYHMGGLAVGPDCRTAVDGLWAAGEAASTGLHGANRLASNSLLEAAVTGRAAALDIAGWAAAPTDLGLPAEPTLAPCDPAVVADIRAVMDLRIGVVRDGPGMALALDRLAALRRAARGTDFADPAAVALLIALAASGRAESRGGHWRSDAGPVESPRHSATRWAELAAFD